MKEMKLLLVQLLLFVSFNPIHTFQSAFGVAWFKRFGSLSDGRLDTEFYSSKTESKEKITQLKNKLGSVLDKTLQALQKNETIIRYVNQNSIPTIIDVQPLKAEMEMQNRNQLEQLKKLGYSDDEVSILKDAVKVRLIEMQLPRPANIPSIWLRKEIRRNLSQIPVSSSESRTTQVRWINPPRKDSEPRETLSNRFSQEENDGLDVWPSREEFKDLLLEESKMRVNTVGNWIAPLVRTENRWRFKLYEAWLRFLQEGFGDQIDILENGSNNNGDDDEDISRNNFVPEDGRGSRKRPIPSLPVKKRVIRSQEEYDEFIREQQRKIKDFVQEQDNSNKPKRILRNVDRFLGDEILSSDNDLFKSSGNRIKVDKISRSSSPSFSRLQERVNPLSNSYDSDEI